MALEARQTEASQRRPAGEGRIAVQQQGEHLGALHDVLQLVLLARTLPSTTGSTISRCEGWQLAAEMMLLLLKVRSEGSAQMVLDVAGALDVVGGVGAAL